MTPTLDAQIKTANGKRRNRIITQDDICLFQSLVDQHTANPTTLTIRVYPPYSFVPKGYDYPAQTSCLIATRETSLQQWTIICCTVDARRPYGKGPRITINGRPQ